MRVVPIVEPPLQFIQVGLTVSCRVFSSRDASVRGSFVSEDSFGIGVDIFFDEPMKGLTVTTTSDLQDNLATTLDGSNDDSLVSLVSTALACNLATDKSLIDFDNVFEMCLIGYILFSGMKRPIQFFCKQQKQAARPYRLSQRSQVVKYPFLASSVVHFRQKIPLNSEGCQAI